MSSKYFRKSERRISPTYLKYPQLLENIKKIYTICGENKSEAARRIGVKPQIFDEWFEGRSAPSTAARRAIANAFGVDTNTLVHGHIEDPPAEYQKKPLDKQRRKLVQLAMEIAEHGEDRFIDHLVDQIGFLNEAMQKKKAAPDDDDKTRNSATTAAMYTIDEPEVYVTRELKGKDDQ